MFSCQTDYKKPTEVMDKERFWALARAPRTSDTVRQARAALAEGNTRGYNIRKMSLPLMVFVGTFEEWEKTLEDKKTQKTWTEKGMWRSQAHVHLNGLVVADFDHLEGDVRKLWEEASARLSEDDRKRIVLVYVTPSGHGLKVVFTADPAVGNLIDNVVDFAARLGLQADESGKDASRGAFMTAEDDILFIDESRLFDYHDAAFAEKYEQAYREGKSQGTKGIQTPPPCGHPLSRGGTYRTLAMLETYRNKGPIPMQLVVVMAVTKAVRAATMTFTTISMMCFFLSFIGLRF